MRHQVTRTHPSGRPFRPLGTPRPNRWSDVWYDVRPLVGATLAVLAAIVLGTIFGLCVWGVGI